MKLFVNDGNAVYRPASPDEVIKSANTIIGRRFRRGMSIKSPSDALDYIRSQIGALEHEVFAAAFLDNRHRLISFDILFRGTIDGTSIMPREVVKDALKHNSAALICAHNHPSGICMPSDADRRITERLKKALDIVDVRILDHLIVAGTESYSFAQSGLL